MGGQRSTVSVHPERSRIEAALREGTPSSHVAEQFNLSRQAVDRYKTKLRARAAVQGDDDRRAMRRQVERLYSSTIDLMTKAKDANAPRAFLAATAEARRCLGLMSKIIGLLNETPPPAVNVAVQVDLSALRVVILDSLKPYPDARRACAKALLEHEAGGGEPPA